MKKSILLSIALLTASTTTLANTNPVASLCSQFATLSEAVMIARYSGASEDESMLAALSSVKGHEEAEAYVQDIVYYSYEQPYARGFGDQYKSVKNTSKDVFDWCVINFSNKA